MFRARQGEQAGSEQDLARKEGRGNKEARQELAEEQKPPCSLSWSFKNAVYLKVLGVMSCSWQLWWPLLAQVPVCFQSLRLDPQF